MAGMKLTETNASDNYLLYLDIIYYSANQYLRNKKSTRVIVDSVIDAIICESPIIIGNNSRYEIATAIRDIYKECYKNNRKNQSVVKLSRKSLVNYMVEHGVNIEGISWA